MEKNISEGDFAKKLKPELEVTKEFTSNGLTHEPDIPEVKILTHKGCYSVIHISIHPSKELCSKMAPG